MKLSGWSIMLPLFIYGCSLVGTSHLTHATAHLGRVDTRNEKKRGIGKRKYKIN